MKICNAKLVACFTMTFYSLVAPGQAMAQSTNASTWSITPYVWGSSTTLDLSFRDQNIASGDLSFSDALDKLDGVLMMHVEHNGPGKWSAFGDLVYLNLSDSNALTLATVDSKNKQLAFDAALAYWPAGVGTELSIFGGLRYSGFDDTYGFRIADTQVAERKSTKDYYDALFGIRYRFDLAERWSLLTQADASFGDSEGTYLLRGNFAYTVGKRGQNQIVFGYQHKEGKFKDGDLTSDFAFSGPMAGFNFRF